MSFTKALNTSVLFQAGVSINKELLTIFFTENECDDDASLLQFDQSLYCTDGESSPIQMDEAKTNAKGGVEPHGYPTRA